MQDRGDAHSAPKDDDQDDKSCSSPESGEEIRPAQKPTVVLPSENCAHLIVAFGDFRDQHAWSAWSVQGVDYFEGLVIRVHLAQPHWLIQELRREQRM